MMRLAARRATEGDMADPTKLLITDRRTKPRLLSGPRHLTPESQRRLRAVIEHPTRATWERAYSLALTPGFGITLWQAVCVVDPTFPTKGPGQQRHWVRVPDQLTIVRAIRAATSGRITREQVVARMRDGLLERLAQDARSTEQPWLARKGFRLVTIPVALFWIGLIAVKVLSGLHRLHGEGALLFPPGMR
jgi:hypothetical protein